MFCPKCGQSLPEGAIFCPSCGFNMSAEYEEATEVSAPPVSSYEKAKKTLSDPLFLATAIILTIAAVAKLFSTGLDILLALIVVGVWMAYAGATGENTNLIGNGISITSVSVKIQYVVTYILAGLLLLCGLGLLAIFASIGGSIGDFVAEIYREFEETYAQMGLSVEEATEISEILTKALSVIGELSGFVLGLILFIITAISAGLMVLFNILFTGRFSKFLKNASLAIKEGRMVEIGDRRCATWILVYGIFMAIDAVSSFVSYNNLFALIASGCIAAACIMSSVMMKKEVE